MTRKTDFIKILQILQKHQVEFIIFGGISAVLHGAPVTTFDLDILHHRAEQKLVGLFGSKLLTVNRLFP